MASPTGNISSALTTTQANSQGAFLDKYGASIQNLYGIANSTPTVPDPYANIGGGTWVPSSGDGQYGGAWMPAGTEAAPAGAQASFTGGPLGGGYSVITAGANGPHGSGGTQELVPQTTAEAFQTLNGGLNPGQVESGTGSFFEKTAGPAIIDTAIGLVTAGIGDALAPTIGAVGAGAVQGAATGAVTSAANSGMSGAPITFGSVGEGALIGAAGGAIGAAAKPLTNSLGQTISADTGLPTNVANTAASGLTKVGTSAVTGALGGALNGQGAVAGAEAGATHAAINVGVNDTLGGLVSGGLSAAGIGTTGIDNAVGSGVGSLGSNLLGTALSGGGANSSGAAPQTSSIGNIGNMAATSSTDSSLASTITGALPGLVSGAASIYGAQNAAEAVTNADTNAINTQNTALGNINNVWSTQQGLGQGADTALGTALGTNGQPANYSGFENMPGYQFAVNQGTQAIQRQAASMGSAYTPNTAAAVGQYVTGTAASDYNTYISQLMGAAGLGTTANQGLQTANQTNANNVSTLQQNQGQAQASGVQGASNTVAGLFGATGAGTGLLNGVLGGSSNMNSSGVPQGNGTAASNSSDPFAGTTLANNQNAINAYDQSNGPTSNDISGLTGSSTYNQGVNAPIQPFDTSSIDTPSYLDLSGY